MNSKRFCDKRLRLAVRGEVLCFALALSTTVCQASVPDWLRAAARDPVTSYPASVEAVVLLDEQQTVVAPDGKIHTITRRAIRILREEGKKKYDQVAVNFDSETQITYLKGWSLAADGKEYELKENQTVVTNASRDELYQDTKYEVLTFPGVSSGTVVGYEYQQNHRPSILQDIWDPQWRIPVRHARYNLQLPPGWQYRQSWMNANPREPLSLSQNQFVWELSDIAAVTHEPKAPSFRAVAVRVGFSFIPPPGAAGRSFTSWPDVAQWFKGLSTASTESSPELDTEVQRLTAPATSPDAKIRILSSYVQKQVRYVAIEIGIGGYVPHSATSTLANKYGDCKDKATLLAVMLRQAGIKAYPVAIYASRGVVRPDFPSPYQFNHMIVAIQLPAGSQFEKSSASLEVDQLGRLLFFDPTAEVWPIGILIDELQDNTGLLMAGDDSRLVTLPAASPLDNQLLRRGEVTLAPDGSLAAKITETYTGSWAARMRENLALLDRQQKSKLFDLLLQGMQGAPSITHAEIQDQNEISNPLVLRYEVQARDYAKLTGNLMLLRPPVSNSVVEKTFEWKSDEGEARKLPAEYSYKGIYSEISMVELPAGFQVDELPEPVKLDHHAVSYNSEVEVEGRKLKFQRDYRVATLTVPAADAGSLKSLYREIRADEQKTVVLKRHE